MAGVTRLDSPPELVTTATVQLVTKSNLVKRRFRAALWESNCSLFRDRKKAGVWQHDQTDDSLSMRNFLLGGIRKVDWIAS
jgi:hypothetical protein